MQCITAVRTTPGTYLVGDQLIQLKQALPEIGIGDDVVAHWRCLSLFFLVEKQETPPLENFQAL